MDDNAKTEQSLVLKKVGPTFQSRQYCEEARHTKLHKKEEQRAAGSSVPPGLLQDSDTPLPASDYSDSYSVRHANISNTGRDNTLSADDCEYSQVVLIDEYGIQQEICNCQECWRAYNLDHCMPYVVFEDFCDPYYKNNVYPVFDADYISQDVHVSCNCGHAGNAMNVLQEQNHDVSQVNNATHVIDLTQSEDEDSPDENMKAEAVTKHSNMKSHTQSRRRSDRSCHEDGSQSTKGTEEEASHANYDNKENRDVIKKDNGSASDSDTSGFIDVSQFVKKLKKRSKKQCKEISTNNVKKGKKRKLSGKTTICKMTKRTSPAHRGCSESTVNCNSSFQSEDKCNISTDQEDKYGLSKEELPTAPSIDGLTELEQLATLSVSQLFPQSEVSPIDIQTVPTRWGINRHTGGIINDILGKMRLRTKVKV